MDTLNIKGKKILVTGGSGFLGKHLIHELINAGAEVAVIDIRKGQYTGVQYHQIDLNDIDALNKCLKTIQPEIIYHLAASLNRSRDFRITNELLNINLNGTVNLLNAIKNVSYDKLIYVSTSEVYGSKTLKAPFKEEAQFIPASPYALSKYCAEVAIQTFSEIYDKNYSILRLFNFFGKKLPMHFFLSQLIASLKSHKDFDMTEGEQLRDFLYIDDVIKALLLVKDKKSNQQVFNVCSGRGQSIKDIALTLKSVLKSKSKINFGALPYRDNEVWNMVGDNTKIKDALGWEAYYSFDEGIRKFLK